MEKKKYKRKALPTLGHFFLSFPIFRLFFVIALPSHCITTPHSFFLSFLYIFPRSLQIPLLVANNRHSTSLTQSKPRQQTNNIAHQHSTFKINNMSTQVANAAVSSSMVSNILTLLRHRQKALVKRGRANPAMSMLALTAVLYFWLGRLRAKKAPPRGMSVPHLKSKFFMMDVGYNYVKARRNGVELKFIQDLSKQGLTLTTEFVGHCLILAFEPSSVQHILVKNFENYPKGKLLFHNQSFGSSPPSPSTPTSPLALTRDLWSGTKVRSGGGASV